MIDAIATIGDNLPPNDVELLQSTLKDKHEKLICHARDLAVAARSIPKEIETDEQAGQASDFIKSITACVKSLEAERVSEKEPYLKLGRAVDGFFRTITDTLGDCKTVAALPLDRFIKQKAREEQRKRMEEAEAARQQAQAEAMAAMALRKAEMTQEAEKMLDQAVISNTVANKAEAAANVKPAELAQARSISGALASLRTIWVGEIVDTSKLDLETLRYHIAPADLQKAINSYVRAGGRELKGANIFEKSETVVR